MQRTASFNAFDSDGKRYIIDIFRKRIETADLDGPGEPVWGIPRYRTQDGRSVNRIEKGNYEIVDDPAVPLNSDDPNSP